MNEQRVYEALDAAGIPYEMHQHEAAYSMDDYDDKAFITPEVTMCKNLVLCNRQQTSYYLLVMLPKKPFRTGVISKRLNSSRLSFAPDEALHDLLGVKSGAVSPLGLLMDTGHRVTLVFDQELQKASRIAFHPLVNTATVIFDGEVFWQQVLPMLGVTPQFIDCD